MKIALLILVAAALVAAAIMIWKRVAAGKPLGLEDIEAKESETTHINLSDLAPDDPLVAVVKDTARNQAAGLDGATVTIHSVTEHERFQAATPQPGHKLIVVDVTFAHFKYGFGLAGVELLDVGPAEPQSCGGDAYQVYLNADGTLHGKQGEDYWRADDKSDTVRLDLVYSAPKAVRKVALGYWERVVVDRRYAVQPPQPPVPQLGR